MEIVGAQTGIIVENAFNTVDLYVGLGLIDVELPKKNNYQFSSLRGFLGISPSWKIAPYAEIGLDLLEEVFSVCNESNEDYCSTDPSYALGVRWKLSSNIMLNAYHKWYEFDGLILTKTKVNTYGLSVGIKF